MAKSIKLDSGLWQRIVEHAKKRIQLTEEFIEHVLEKELSKEEDTASQQEVERRLKGLGYLE